MFLAKQGYNIIIITPRIVTLTLSEFQTLKGLGLKK